MVSGVFLQVWKRPSQDVLDTETGTGWERDMGPQGGRRSEDISTKGHIRVKRARTEAEIWLQQDLGMGQGVENEFSGGGSGGGVWGWDPLKAKYRGTKKQMLIAQGKLY